MFSPDGRWVAYASNETGQMQVFLKSFPRPGASRQVSTAGGIWPIWRRDGGELFYVESDRLMAVPVMRGGTSLELGTPRMLFRFPQGWGGFYQAAPDGQRFLITRTVTDTSPITVILNWKPAP